MSGSGVDIHVYIDVVFFVNFFMDTLLLYLLGTCLKRPAPFGRLMCGGAIGGIFGCAQVCLWQLPAWVMASASFGAAALMVAAAYRPKGWRELVKETGGLYLFATFVSGAMEFCRQYTRAGFYVRMLARGEREWILPLFAWLFLVAGGCLLAVGLWQFAQEMAKERKHRYVVILSDGEVRVEATAYLDTGNFLREPKSGKAVQIVTERIWNRFAAKTQEKVMIPYHTVGNPCGVMAGIQIEQMEICGVKRAGGTGKLTLVKPWIAKAPYGLSMDNSYEVLLHGEAAADQPDKEGGITSGD